MQTRIFGKHFVLVAAVVIVWTHFAIGFSMSLGERSQRSHDQGPSALAELIPIFVLYPDARRET